MHMVRTVSCRAKETRWFRARVVFLTLLVAAVTLGAAPAHAQDAEKARQLFQQGSKYYDLGQFDKAIEAWQQGYDQKPDPGFLYNIAQAYRQKQDAQKAIFFYKGYLRNSPKAHNRAEVEQKIAALQKQAGDSATPPPTTTTTPPPTTTTTPPPTTTTPPNSTLTATTPADPPQNGAVQPPPPTFPDATPTTVAQASPPASEVSERRIDTTAGIGPAFWSSGVNGTAKPSFVLTLGGHYLFGAPMSRFRFRLGALAGFTFLQANEDSSNVTFLSFLLDPALEIRLTQSGRWFGTVDLAVGLQILTGVKDRSKLLSTSSQMLQVSGAQGMAETRIGAGLGYRLTPEIALFTSLARMDSPKKNQYFYADIVRVEWLFGVAYRL
jgi:hypothetical protein